MDGEEGESRGEKERVLRKGGISNASAAYPGIQICWLWGKKEEEEQDAIVVVREQVRRKGKREERERKKQKRGGEIS